jgi:hypothetical protein
MRTLVTFADHRQQILVQTLAHLPDCPMIKSVPIPAGQLAEALRVLLAVILHAHVLLFSCKVILVNRTALRCVVREFARALLLTPPRRANGLLNLLAARSTNQSVDSRSS